MGIFDSFKNKKAPLPELEMPPSPEVHNQEQKPFEPMPGQFEHPPEMPEGMSMPSEMPSFEEAPAPPEEMRAPEPHMSAVSQPLPMPQAPSIPQISMPEHISIPEHHEELSLFQQQKEPTFKMYYAQQEHEESVQQIPVDVTQELLSLPKSEPKIVAVKAQVPRQYLTMSAVVDIQGQITNLYDDIALGKDKAYRLVDLNEQEIEKMAKWHALHEAMELRMAQIDKILFKA